MLVRGQVVLVWIVPVLTGGVLAVGCGGSSGGGFSPPGSTTTAPIRSANSGSVASTSSGSAGGPVNLAPELTLTPVSSAKSLNVVHVLTAQAKDDGLPRGTLTFTWSQVSGPETAWISNPTAAELRVGLPATGVYVMRCEVSDGEQTTFLDVQLEGEPIVEVPAFPAAGFLSRNLTGEEQATAYYDTIDPQDDRSTLAGFRQTNGFDQGADAEAIYFNEFDLGFGRDMSAKVNGDDQGWIVTNHANLDDTIAGRDEIATVAMEVSLAPNNQRFTKFYVYDDQGRRISGADLDGHGTKYVPDLCISCHGGSPQPIANGVYGNGGNVGSRLLPFDVEGLSFSNRNGFTQADQEAGLKELNLVVHQASVTPPASKQLIEGWYGGATFPLATQDTEFVPAEWATEKDLYLDVVATSCRTCHVAMDAPLDFTSSAGFKAYSPTIHKELEARTMPDSRRTFEAFWSSPRPALLAAALVDPTPVQVDLSLNRLAGQVERQLETDSSQTLLDIRVDFAGMGELVLRSPTELIDAAEDRMAELDVQRRALLDEGRGGLAQQAEQRIESLDRRRRDMQQWLAQNSLAQLQTQQSRLDRDWRDLLQQADVQLRNPNNRRAAQNRVRNDVNRLVQDLRSGIRRLERLQRSIHSNSTPIRPAER